jgi:hypothetical protein
VSARENRGKVHSRLAIASYSFIEGTKSTPLCGFSVAVAASRTCLYYIRDLMRRALDSGWQWYSDYVLRMRARDNASFWRIAEAVMTASGGFASRTALQPLFAAADAALGHLYKRSREDGDQSCVRPENRDVVLRTIASRLERTVAGIGIALWLASAR